jgi:hypothetical protein
LIKKIPYKYFLTVALAAGLLNRASAQETDSLVRPAPVDSVVRTADPLEVNKRQIDSVLLKHSPRKAAFRSAVLPGWGQIYNKKYWKLPIVYGALGVSAGVFIYNVKNYRELRFAYKAKVLAAGPTFDSTMYNQLQSKFIRFPAEDLRYYRDEFRRNIDYSVLAFILLWGLNVVDATVDAHLKTFDVSPELGLRFKPGYSEMAGTNGISIILAFK